MPFRIWFVIPALAGAMALSGCQDLGPEPVQAEKGVEEPPFDLTSVNFASMNYQMVPIGTLGGGTGWARGINNSNAVVGMAQNGEGQLRAFLWKDGVMEELEGLDGSVSGAYAINDDGVIVGEAETAAGHMRAVIWRNGQPLELGTLGGATSQALSINHRGEVVGRAENANGEVRPFLWRQGSMEELPLPPGDPFFASAEDINDAGEIVGTVAGAGQQALLWSRGTVTVLETECSEAGAQGINERGQVVGGGLHCPISQFEIVPLLWNGDRPARHLEPIGGLREHELGFQNTGTANAVNTRGHIVGWSDADPEVTARDQSATLWYRNKVINLGGEPDFPSASDINDRGVAVGRSALMPALFVAESQVEVFAARFPEGLEVQLQVGEDGLGRVAAADLFGSRAGEAWAVRLCAAKGRVSGPPTVSDVLAGC